MLLKLKKQGITILVSTPYMDEATLCDRIALIQNGNFLEVDTPVHIVSRYPTTLWSVRSEQMHRLLKDLRDHPHVKSSFSFGKTFHVTLDASISDKELKDYLIKLGHSSLEIQAISPSIEDCFMLLSINK